MARLVTRDPEALLLAEREIAGSSRRFEVTSRIARGGVNADVAVKRPWGSAGDPSGGAPFLRLVGAGRALSTGGRSPRWRGRTQRAPSGTDQR